MAGAPGRLRWHCRRGMKELDVLLERYLDERYAFAVPEEQAAFANLLENQDPVIYAYCMGRDQPPAHLAALIETLTAGPVGGR